jgi:hypothetical protein
VQRSHHSAKLFCSHLRNFQSFMEIFCDDYRPRNTHGMLARLQRVCDMKHTRRFHIHAAVSPRAVGRIFEETAPVLTHSPRQARRAPTSLTTYHCHLERSASPATKLPSSSTTTTPRQPPAIRTNNMFSSLVGYNASVMAIAAYFIRMYMPTGEKLSSTSSLT